MSEMKSTAGHKTLQNIEQLNELFHQASYHSLVSIVDLADASPEIFEPTDFGCYCVILMNSHIGDIIKDGVSLSYKVGTMFTVKPGEVLSLRPIPGAKPKGRVLAFRPELIENTGLGRDFYLFTFFNYDVFEALELKEEEGKVIRNCYDNIEAELRAENDELTNHMLRLGIGLLLSYCKRYYERQFDTKKLKSSELVRRLDAILDSYYAPGSELPRLNGVPTVAWCSSQFHLAPNYFGNLLRRDLHVSAQRYIQDKVVERAKMMLADPSKTIDQVAEQLGFAYSNHFSRLFRNRTGLSPSQFRQSLD
ncbi:MAG: helix-turn-helix transcriptional regulator [Bacteroidales bacterium]|nr:helix-turn-helix transcriptional regulator [Bacteroidales bacterium]